MCLSLPLFLLGKSSGENCNVKKIEPVMWLKPCLTLNVIFWDNLMTKLSINIGDFKSFRINLYTKLFKKLRLQYDI